MKSKNKRTCNIRGLTGVRFNENISDSANILVILDGVHAFVESVEVSDGFAADFQSLCSNSNFKHVQEDLTVLVLFNAFYFECAYRAIVNVNTKVAEYKQLLNKMLEIFRLDSDECFDLLKLGNELPFIEKFYHPSEFQLEVITNIDNYDEDQLARVKVMVELVKGQMEDSIYSINAVLFDNEFEGDMNNASLNNNACESGFGLLDYYNRTKINLSFLFKETIIMAVKNKFFESFDRKSPTEQKEMMKKAGNQANKLYDMIKKNDEIEETLQLDNEAEARRARVECREMQQLRITSLRGKIANIVPSGEGDYDRCLADYLCSVKPANETLYLKSLLHLLKLTLKNKKLPAKSFTVSADRKPLVIAALRVKLFKLL